ncbi:MAG: single-stranded-DNA-specific exonuclease RecJ [Flavobacteriales bacterium]|nr:single-stranded-DNA-specific exonuclease RecJ [Flavobacteriales bacterium]
MMLNYRWQKKEIPDPVLIARLQSELKVNRIVASLLVQRGISDFESARDFFRPSLAALHDPFLFRDMQKAVDRIQYALDHNEKILVYGDYDVDGTTSVAMMYDFLHRFTEKVEYYIPDRYLEGYGVSEKGIEHAAAGRFSLIIALDCGIRSNRLVDLAKSHGIDFIICDHHIPGKEVPKALAVLDAKVPGETYPFKELSGCGVGFKLIQAICLAKGLDEKSYAGYLDLVAVSTCSDIVSMTGENRILVYFGLKKLNEDPGAGLRVLKESCVAKEQIRTSDVVFYIGPRINAVGRLYDAKTAVKLLTAKSETEAVKYSAMLNETNAERKEIDEGITKEALEMIRNDPEFGLKKSTVLFSKNWHKGVIGIVASRMIEQHYRPTIILAYSDGKISGSARSIRGFDIHEALVRCEEHLLQFGGHRYAAGLSLVPEKLEDFKEAFERVARSELSDEQLVPEMVYDLEIKPEEITESLVRLLQQFEPFGPDNMSPVFYLKHLRDTGMARQMGEGYKHLSLNLSVPKFEYPLKGLGFNLGHKYDEVKGGGAFSALVSIEENEFRGQKTVQLNLKDMR